MKGKLRQTGAINFSGASNQRYDMATSMRAASSFPLDNGRSLGSEIGARGSDMMPLKVSK